MVACSTASSSFAVSRRYRTAAHPAEQDAKQNARAMAQEAARSAGLRNTTLSDAAALVSVASERTRLQAQLERMERAATEAETAASHFEAAETAAQHRCALVSEEWATEESLVAAATRRAEADSQVCAGGGSGSTMSVHGRQGHAVCERGIMSKRQEASPSVPRPLIAAPSPRRRRSVGGWLGRTLHATWAWRAQRRLHCRSV